MKFCEVVPELHLDKDMPPDCAARCLHDDARLTVDRETVVSSIRNSAKWEECPVSTELSISRERSARPSPCGYDRAVPTAAV